MHAQDRMIYGLGAYEKKLQPQKKVIVSDWLYRVEVNLLKLTLLLLVLIPRYFSLTILHGIAAFYNYAYSC
jgi:hypothetical protein